jgi:hypothetical protein
MLSNVFAWTHSCSVLVPFCYDCYQGEGYQATSSSSPHSLVCSFILLQIKKSGNMQQLVECDSVSVGPQSKETSPSEKSPRHLALWMTESGDFSRKDFSGDQVSRKEYGYIALCIVDAYDFVVGQENSMCIAVRNFK